MGNLLWRQIDQYRWQSDISGGRSSNSTSPRLASGTGSLVPLVSLVTCVCEINRLTCVTCVTKCKTSHWQPKTKYQMTTTKQTDILANVASDNYDYSVQHEPSWWQLVALSRCLRPPSPFFSLLFLRFSSQSIHCDFILIVLVIIHLLVHSRGSIIVSSTRNSYRDGVKTQQMYLQNSSVKGKCNFLAKHSSSSRPKWVELWLNSVKHIWFGLVWDLSCPKKCQCIATRGEHLASTKDDRYLLPDDFKLVRSSPHC